MIILFRNIILGILILFISSEGYTQHNNLGTPFVRNFYKKFYQAGTQNWDVEQDRTGIMYFANNEGMLVFDGVRFEIFPLTNRTIVRSLAVDENGRIYAGGQDEMGYFEPDEKGNLQYISLMHLVPENSASLTDIWNIEIVEDQVFFRTDDKLIVYSDNVLVFHETGNRLTFLGKSGSRVFVHDHAQGMMEFKGNNLQLIPGTERLIGMEVKGLLSGQNGDILIAALHNGVFVLNEDRLTSWETSNNDFFLTNKIFDATQLDDKRFAFASPRGGILITDENGRATHLLNKQNGLQSNNALTIYADRSQNLWLGLDNGIDLVEISSPFSKIIPDSEFEGTGYVVAIHEENIYFGTNNGLYAIPWSNYYNPFEPLRYQLVGGTQGQVWGLDFIGGELLLGHHEGGFQIDGYSSSRISPTTGTWKYAMDETNPNVMLSGTYNGLDLFSQSSGNWNFEGSIGGLQESSRFLIQDGNGIFWISHPYRGIYKATFNSERKNLKYRLYNSEDGLPSDLYNHVFRINNEAIFASERGVFRYDSDGDRFLPFDSYNDVLGSDTRVIRLIQDDNGDIWYVTEKEVGLLKVVDSGIDKQVRKFAFSELSESMVGGFEHIYPHDERNVFFGSEKGFIHLDLKKWMERDTILHVVLNKAIIDDHKGEIVHGGMFRNIPSADSGSKQRENNFREFESSTRSFRFEFSATYYGERDLVEYAYKLEGQEDEWSEWSKKSEKEYTNLAAGDYEFSVKARIKGNMQSDVVSYSFKIAPPWYASSYARGIYTICLAAFLLGLILIPRRKYRKEKELLVSQQQKLEEEHKQIVEQSEQEIIKLKNEKLEAAVEHQNQELAAAAMHLVQKGEILSKIKSELERISKNSNEPETRMNIRKIVGVIDKDIELDENWEQFSMHFDQVHNNFLQKLRDKYPGLSPKDHKLSAYIRMNLSTKEIAPLMNISVRGVEISRYRLRKKLDLDRSTNLVKFLVEL